MILISDRTRHEDSLILVLSPFQYCAWRGIIKIGRPRDEFGIAHTTLRAGVLLISHWRQCTFSFAARSTGQLSCCSLSYRTAWMRIWSGRSEEHTSEIQSHSFISYAVFC